jgi:hypothetical protein
MSILKAYTDLSVGLLSKGEQLLWFRLFLINNKAGWIEWFGADNRRLMLECGIANAQTLDKARQRLKDLGFIDFRKGKGNQPTKYKLLAPGIFDSVGKPKNESKKSFGSMSEPKTEPNIEPKTEPNIEPIYKTIDNDNDNKKKSASHSKKTPSKTQYAEAVSMTNDEHKSLMEKLCNEKAVSWCIDKLNNYKLSSGKKYKSDYRAILNWVIDEYQKKEPVKTKSSLTPGGYRRKFVN